VRIGLVHGDAGRGNAHENAIAASPEGRLTSSSMVTAIGRWSNNVVRSSSLTQARRPTGA